MPDDDMARQILDEFSRLPDTADEGVDSLHRRFTDLGLRLVDHHDATPSGETANA